MSPYFEEYFWFELTRTPNVVIVHAFNDHFPANLQIIEKRIKTLIESVAEFEYDEYQNRLDLYKDVKNHLQAVQP